MHRKLRLRKRADFNVVYRYGRSFANSQFVVYWRRRAQKGSFRMGVSASSKLGNAVVRNRLRRMVKEIIRLNASKLQEDMDLILIVRKPAISLPYKEMESSILHVLRKASLFKGMHPNAVGTQGSGARTKRPPSRNGNNDK